MSYSAVLDLPARTFWMFNKNIDRVSAERDMRSAMIAIKTQSGDGMKDLFAELSVQMNTPRNVITFDTEAMVKNAITKDENNRSDLADLNHIGDLG